MVKILFQLIYNEESAANILEKYAKKTIIESREVCVPPPSSYFGGLSNNFSLNQLTNASLNCSNTLSSPFVVF